MNCRDIAELMPLYLCGELDGPRAVDFAGHLAACPECAQKVKRERYYDARLREIVLTGGADATPVSERVREHIATESAAAMFPQTVPRRMRRLGALAIGIAATFALLALGYDGLLGPQIAPVYAAAVFDHRLEVVDHQPRHWVTDAGQIDALAVRQGVAPSSILALARRGYHPDRAKICFLNAKAFLHVVYSNGAQEFSVYLRRQEIGQLPGLEQASASGSSVYTCKLDSGYVASFQKSGLAVVVVSNESAASADSFARLASSLL
jgi:anti-sigma factor RsiW